MATLTVSMGSSLSAFTMTSIRYTGTAEVTFVAKRTINSYEPKSGYRGLWAIDLDTGKSWTMWDQDENIKDNGIDYGGSSRRIRLYSQPYTPPTPTYTCSFYHQNTSTKAAEPISVQSGGSITLPYPYSRTGMSFVGWSCPDEEIHQAYTNYGPLYANAIFYAVWQTATYTLTYYYSGTQTEAATSQTVSYGESVTLPNPYYSVQSHFSGWLCGDERTRSAGATYGPITANEVIYAIVNYTISFSSNGGSGQMSSQTKKYKVDFTLPNCGFTAPVGKEFDYWGLDPNQPSSHYPAGSTFQGDYDATFYAIWKSLTYTYHFSGNGGSGQIQDRTRSYGSSFTFPENGFVHPSLSFRGWGADAQGDVDYYAGTTYSAIQLPNANTTFYAIWGNPQSRINFHDENGNNLWNPVFINQGSTYTFPTYTPTGWTFNNRWKKLPETTGITYNANQTYTITDLTLNVKADCTKNSYTVEYNLDGAQSPSRIPSQTAPYQTQFYLSSTIPSKIGYSFDHWQEIAEFVPTGNNYNPGALYTVTRNVVMKAIYNRGSIDYFSWHGGTQQDNSYFQTGKSFSVAVSHTSWNELQNIIETIYPYATSSSQISFASVTSGQAMTSSIFNNVRDAIYTMNTSGTIVNRVSQGQTITPFMFINDPNDRSGNNPNSLKAAINIIIQKWNNGEYD